MARASRCSGGTAACSRRCWRCSWRSAGSPSRCPPVHRANDVGRAHPGRLAHAGGGAGGAGPALAARGPDGALARPRGDPGRAAHRAGGGGTGARAGPPASARDALFPVVTLLLTVGVLLWANIALAGDVAAWLGARRWQGIVITAGAGMAALTGAGGRCAGRRRAALDRARLAVPRRSCSSRWALGLGPDRGAGTAWPRSPPSGFPPSSPWVSGGRELRAVRGQRRRSSSTRCIGSPRRPAAAPRARTLTARGWARSSGRWRPGRP